MSIKINNKEEYMKKKQEKINELPKLLKVKILQNRISGTFVAEIETLDISTEADSLDELDFNINDLIYTYFDIPKRLQSEIWYKQIEREVSPKGGRSLSLGGMMRFQILLTPQANRYYNY